MRLLTILLWRKWPTQTYYWRNHIVQASNKHLFFLLHFRFPRSNLPAQFDYYLLKKRDGKQMSWKLIFIFKCNQKSIATERNSIKYRLSQKLFKNQNSTPDAKNGRFLLNFSCLLYLPSFKLKLLILNKTLEYSIALAIQHYLWNKKDANKLFNGNKKYFSLINSIY